MWKVCGKNFVRIGSTVSKNVDAASENIVSRKTRLKFFSMKNRRKILPTVSQRY